MTLKVFKYYYYYWHDSIFSHRVVCIQLTILNPTQFLCVMSTAVREGEHD